jgi:hypothetical protein
VIWHFKQKTNRGWWRRKKERFEPITDEDHITMSHKQSYIDWNIRPCFLLMHSLNPLKEKVSEGYIRQISIRKGFLWYINQCLLTVHSNLMQIKYLTNCRWIISLSVKHTNKNTIIGKLCRWIYRWDIIVSFDWICSHM